MEAPSGGRLRSKGKHGVPCRLNCVVHAWALESGSCTMQSAIQVLCFSARSGAIQHFWFVLQTTLALYILYRIVLQLRCRWVSSRYRSKHYTGKRQGSREDQASQERTGRLGERNQERPTEDENQLGRSRSNSSKQSRMALEYEPMHLVIQLDVSWIKQQPITWQ